MKLTIGEASRITGIPAHTIRYYEKLGLIPIPNRLSGKDRVYSNHDLQFIQFLLGLKTTGMSLAELKEIVDAGCLRDTAPNDQKEIIERRMAILEKHLHGLLEQQISIEKVIDQTKEKLKHYKDFLSINVQ
jgi:DNA-binding transcriptional MerR regulator